MTPATGNVRYVRISRGFLLVVTSYESGVVDNGNFWRFEWLVLEKL